MSRPRRAFAFTLRDAHREYLAMLNDCACDLCDQVCFALTDFNRYAREFHTSAAERYYTVMGDRLRALVEGQHVFVSLKEAGERARLVFREKHGRDPRPQEGINKVRMSDFYATGMGLGMTPGRYRMAEGGASA